MESKIVPESKHSGGQKAAAASSRGQALAFESFPDTPAERERLDAISQTPDDNGNVYCWRRRRRCSNPDCRDPETLTPHKFKEAEHALWNCPICGRDRHCRRLTSLPNRGCHQHGGATPTGWDLPQTKSGEFSKHLKLELRADFERMLSSESLMSLEESIAFLKMRMNEIVAEYGGGASRALLKQMKENRAEYKRQMRQDEPDPALLRQLDRDLDKMIAEGSRAYTVMHDFTTTLGHTTRAIDARDRHVQNERMMITSDKAWVLLAHTEETFRVGAEMVLEMQPGEALAFVKEMNGLLEACPDDGARQVTAQETMRAYLSTKKRALLSYASKRFTELAGSGLVPGPRPRF